MGSATIYILLSNDGEQDFILTSDKILHTRLQKIRNKNISLKRKMEARTGRPSNESIEAQIADVTQTHNLWIHRRFHPYVAMAHTFIVTQIFAGSLNLRSGGAMQFDLEYAGEFYNKACLHFKITESSIGLDGPDKQYFAMAPRFAHKLVKDVEWRVNTNELDKYDNHFMNSNYEFEIPEDKRAGYNRCIGQQNPEVARVNQFESVITATGGSLGSAGYDEEVSVTNGFQTRKTAHSEMEIFLPLQFWWNQESEESFSVLTVPNGQRIIKVNIEKLENLIQMYDKNGAPIAYDVNKFTTEPTFETAELYVQNIYINPEINDIYIDRIGFNLVSLHRYQDFSISSSRFNERLSLFKWPVEELRYAALPRENSTNTRVEDWDNYAVVDPQTVNLAGRWHSNDSTVSTVQLTATHRKCYDIFKTISFTIQGLKLYDNFPSSFFQDFTPTAFSEEHGRVAPKKGCSWGLINFNQKLGNPELSGHVNISRVRESFFSGTTEHVGAGAAAPAVDEVIVHVQGKARNFTFITNGNIIIRFVS